MFVRKFAASTFQNDRLARFLSSIMSNIELQTKLDLKVDLPTSPPLSVQFYQHVILTYCTMYIIGVNFLKKIVNLPRCNTHMSSRPLLWFAALFFECNYF